MIFAFLGALFVLLAAVGVLRLPNTLARMHAATLATSFGILLTLIGAVVTTKQWSAVGQLSLAVIFLCLIQPIGVALLGRKVLKDDSSESER
jgi:multicomponent Na+:H+ antiporter subunit G